MSDTESVSTNLGKFDNTAVPRSVAVFLIVTLVLISFGISRAQSTGNTSQNLNNIDIHALIETVSQRASKNFIVDPRVQSTITAFVPEELEGDQLYEFFLSILDVHGLAAVPAGSFIKIVPLPIGVQGPVPVLGDKDAVDDELVTRVIPVSNVPAQQMIAVLRPLLPQPASLSADTTSNALIITDRAANIDRLEEIIRSLDNPH